MKALPAAVALALALLTTSWTPDPAVAQQGAGEPAYTELIFGAWTKTTLKVEFLFMSNLYYDVAPDAVRMWELAFPSLDFLLPASCENAPCAPDEEFDILVTDAFAPIGQACYIPDCAPLSPTLRDDYGIHEVCYDAPVECPDFLLGAINGPVMVFVPPVYAAATTLKLFTPNERFNFVAHEFGHALGLGHADAPDDPMNTYLVSSTGDRGRLCVTNLDVTALEEAYGYLPGPFVTPDTQVAVRQSMYDRQVQCSP